jgi:membrane protease YdiL (CAAX protease family)
MSTELPPADPGASPPDQRQPIHPDTLLRAAIGLGLIMTILGVGWAALVGQRSLEPALRPADLGWLLPGLAAGAIFAAVAWRLGQRISGIRRIVAMLDETLDLNAMRFRHVVAFSLLAAVPEEILFRGALQPELGLLVVALIFGGLHALTWLYFVYATLAGLVLGTLFLLSGTLWMPIGAHFAIDLVMFLLLLQRRHHFF